MSKLPGKTETIETAEFPAFDTSKATEQVHAVVDQGLIIVAWNAIVSGKRD
ncbi:hypothetical protein [Mesorhizobium shangrilense]|uniref:Uncharacterized protein n=1 Tax=Mesorhizobium shangrilense TaxID=460060 RepID=A0ABV2DR33_9HYPH